jgi:hypothetical protein
MAKGLNPGEYRPSPERQGRGRAYGAPCGLGDAGFADWSCDDGFDCVAGEDKEIGSCQRVGEVGNACEYGVLHPGKKPHRDHLGLKPHACAASLKCEPNLHGFAQGYCSSTCGDAVPASLCAPFTDADGFQNCLRHHQKPSECVAAHVFNTGLRACDAENPCREDYVCMRSNDDKVGACLPPYFVYQLRLDGYPLPR